MEVFVSAQPIFNHRKKTFAYELSYKTPARMDDESNASQLMITAFTGIGLDRLTGGKPAIISLTKEHIINEAATLFPPAKLIVEITEDLSNDVLALSKLKMLKKSGYLIIMHQSLFINTHPDQASLTDIIRLDFNTHIKPVSTTLKKIKYLAADISNDEMFETAEAMGCSYFKGDFFSKPVVYTAKEISPIKLNHLMLIQKANTSSVDFEELSTIISRDVSLSYNLLKLLNSAAFSFRKKITSIKHALAILGEKEIKKWISLIALKEISGDDSDEIMRTALIRAKFLELLAGSIALSQKSSDFFLMGLFSILDVLMHMPIDQALDDLPINMDIKKALISNEGPLKDYIRLVNSYERGNWSVVDKYSINMGIDSCILPEIYLRSSEWADIITAPITS
jgi:c-di-GMP-related signal transduction protein